MALGLGANLGRPERALETALRSLREALSAVRVSPLYRTQPVSDLPQPDFYNLAVVARTRLPAKQLLSLLQSLERAAGRVREGPRNGPRPLDIDILLYGEEISEDPALTLPHPRLRDRRFVLEPLAEIAPHLKVPPDGATVAELLAQLPAEEWVRRTPWPKA